MEKLAALIVLVIASILLVSDTCWGLKIASFNIQAFGRKKIGKTEVVDTLIQIVQRYDVTLLQEIRDSAGTVVLPPFLDRVNSNATVYTYALAVSENLGRSSHKEKYAYIYRTERVEVLQTYQYADPADEFEREPFSVLLRTRESGQENPLELFLLGVHIRPDSVCSELAALEQAYLTTSDQFDGARGLMLGDFNAGCSYMSGCAFQQISVVSNPLFSWLVDCAMDTTVKRTYCAYDRIVAGGGLKDCVVPESVQVFRFDLEYSLSQSQAEDVSDHYPVEVELNSQCSCLQSIKLFVVRGTHRYALSNGPHTIKIVTHSEYAAHLIDSESFWGYRDNELTLSLQSDFGFTTCVRKGDVESVAIVPMSNDGWQVKTIVTFVCESESRCTLLTQDLDVNYWVDADGSTNGDPLTLSLV